MLITASMVTVCLCSAVEGAEQVHTCRPCLAKHKGQQIPSRHGSNSASMAARRGLWLGRSHRYSCSILVSVAKSALLRRYTMPCTSGAPCGATSPSASGIMLPMPPLHDKDSTQINSHAKRYNKENMPICTLAAACFDWCAAVPRH